MLEFIMFFLLIVFIISIILLYKKYIKIKNVVESEQKLKYKSIKQKIGSNNVNIDKMEEVVEDITGVTLKNLTSDAEENKNNIYSNNQFITTHGIDNINDIFNYENQVFKIGGNNSANIEINSKDLKINVPNNVCINGSNNNGSNNNDCNYIITEDDVDAQWPISKNFNS
jgi:hypothetical protein